MALDALRQMEQALRDASREDREAEERAQAAGEARRWEYRRAASAVTEVLSHVQRLALERETGAVPMEHAVVAAMATKGEGRIVPWWAASAEDTYRRVSLIGDVDLGTASVFVAAAFYSLHLGKVDITTPAVIDLAGRGLAFDKGRSSLAGARA